MNNSSVNDEKIKRINEGKWTVNCNEFFVKIDFEYNSNHIEYERILNQNELTAIQTQINLSKLGEDDSENNPYSIFNYQFEKMKEYHEIIKYFNFQGITNFTKSFEDHPFEDFEQIFDDDWINFNYEIKKKKKTISKTVPIYENFFKASFLTNDIRHSTFRIIGEIIQKNDTVHDQLLPYIKCILGAGVPKEPFNISLQNFLTEQSFDTLFDTFKLGYSFCQFISDPNNSSDITKTNKSEDSGIINEIKNLKATISYDFDEDFNYSFTKRNLLFLKVERPVHCYHCIRSITKIVRNEAKKFYLNEKTLIFCQNGSDFVNKINEIAQTSVKDTNKSYSGFTYFIVHPEMLNEEDHSFFVEFLNARMNFLSDSKLPKVIVISSLNYKTFCYNHISKFKDIEFNIPKELIKKLYKLSYPDDFQQYNYELYYSENAGAGKTYQIIQDFNKAKEKEEDDVLETLFIDINMTKIPKIENNKFVHFDLSSELFDNNYQFFDSLWISTILHYQINPDGTTARLPKNIFFEVPTLTKSQFPDGGFIDETDFPIFCDKYHEISSKNINKDDEAQIKIPESVKQFCDLVFKEKMEYTSELLKKSLNMFYPKDFDFDESLFVPRILVEINMFMDKFCKNLSIENEKSKAIFLLLLRTNFHVWNVDSLFTKKRQPKSFIIMTNQNLFGDTVNNEKWILLCFSSIDEENNKWDTTCLNNDIVDSNEIDESKLFKYKSFSDLIDDKNIEVYSNQLNFENNQAYFFSIIRTFFYLNNDKESNYRKITDGVILNDIKNSDSFDDKFKSILIGIKGGKDYYEQSEEFQEIHKWTKVFDSLNSIFSDYDKEPSDLIDELSENDTVKQISNTTLTMTIVKRFIIMIVRVILKQPLIFEGFTGVGKTWSVKLLRMLIEIAGEENNDFKWAFHQIDCHGAYQLSELLKSKKEDEFDTNVDSSMNHIFFFDELNTSPISSYIINEMNNYYLKKVSIQNDQSVFIAAINPYKEVDKFSREMSRVGIKQVIPNRISKLKLCCVTPDSSNDFYEVTDLNKLAYNVRELSESTKMIVLKSDPEMLFVNEEDKKIKSSEYLPPDEIKTILHIITFYFNTLIEQTNYNSTSNILENAIEDKEKLKTNLSIIKQSLLSNKNQILKIVHSYLCESFLEIRELMRLKSILSYRDIKRSMQFFILFFKKLVKVYLRKKGEPDITKDVLKQKIIPQSIVLSMMISIVFRFSNETKIKAVTDNPEYEQNIKDRCEKFGLIREFSEDRSYFKISIRSALLRKLQAIKFDHYEWEKPIKIPEDWNQVVISYAWLKCMKYIYNQESKTDINSSLFKLNSLMTHLFAISSCYSACKNNKDCVIPCMIIGMPGTSKTLAIQLFTDYKQKNSKNKSNFFSTTYLSTRVSEAEGLNAHYRDCSMFMMTHENGFAVCVIDELGLANLNETRPLKLLHYYFDKGIRMESSKKKENLVINVPVMSIAASNYALDYANMNRGVLICTDLPTDEEIAKAFCFSELESENTIVDKNYIEEYKNDYFDNNEKYFKWIIDSKVKIESYKGFLKILWELTYLHKRPEMLTLRPLYLLFNSIFHNKKIENEDETIGNLCLYLISAISCKPNDSYEKLKSLVIKLDPNNQNDESFKEMSNKIVNHKNNCFNTFREIFNGQKNNDFYQQFCQIIIDKFDKKDKIDEPKKKKKTKKAKKAKKGKKVEIKNEYLKKIYDKIKEYENEYHLEEEEEEEEENAKAFDFFYDIIKKEDKDDVYYNSLKEISKLKDLFKDLIADVNDSKYDNYKILRQSVISFIKGKSKRALCFRTKNYECLDFIEELLETTTAHYLRDEKRDIKFTHIYPSDFKLSRQISADNAIQDIIDIISSSKGDKSDAIHYVLMIGNVCLIDSLLDLLNSPSEGKADFKTKNPLMSRNGFSVELKEFPKNIVFCFIMNESDFNNRDSADSFPVPLLDRLNQLYLDYDQRDEFGIIEGYQQFYLDQIGLSIPYSVTIHEYFNKFVNKLTDVPIPKDENQFAVVFSIKDDRDFKPDENTDFEYEEISIHDYDFDEISFSKKILLVNISGSKNLSDEYIENVQQIIKDLQKDKREFIYYWSQSTKLYKQHENLKVPFPTPKNYSTLEYDGSINKYINKIKVQNNKAIILTTSPMMEEINLEVIKSKKKSLIQINSDDTLFLFDQYITSFKNLEDRIESKKKKNIIIQLNHYQIEHDRYLRHILESFEKEDNYIIIVYHFKNSIVPESLFTSENWPVYWIESITKSPLSEFPTTEIVECILFKEYYNERKKDIILRILKQIYKDIDSLYEKDINGEKKDDQISSKDENTEDQKKDGQISSNDENIEDQKKDDQISSNDDNIEAQKKVDQILNYVYENLEKYSTFLKEVKFDDLNTVFKGQMNENSYQKIEFKREFCSTIIKQIPFLERLIRLLILNVDAINKKSDGTDRDIEDTNTFISNLFKNSIIDDMLDQSEIDKKDYKQLNNAGLFFPELVLPQVRSIYEIYINDKANFDKRVKDVFNPYYFYLFYNFQVDPPKNYMFVYCQNYFMSYLSNINSYDQKDFKGFAEKVQSLIDEK